VEVRVGAEGTSSNDRLFLLGCLVTAGRDLVVLCVVSHFNRLYKCVWGSKCRGCLAAAAVPVITLSRL
jgi:hypothetical protein